MKDQYFGDVNDYRKYGLLRALTIEDGLRLGICWMLTENDSRSDGNLLSYLGQDNKYRRYDPTLFDWLRKIVEIEKERSLARIEETGLLGRAVFQSRLLKDCTVERLEYFAECASRFCGCDLVFFDPDNGFEIASRPFGRRHSSKHIYWEEVAQIFESGSSVLIYQHFVRENRERYADGIVDRLRRSTGAAAVFSFATPHVLFVLASHHIHAAIFQRQCEVISAHWHGQITATEHRVEIEHTKKMSANR